MAAQLQLRDVHLPPSPGWWPPAPGWWLVAALVLAVIAIPCALAWRRRRRRRRWLQLFDRELATATGDGARLAAMSALLRRAARRVDPRADLLQGDAWLQLLDGRKRHDFSEGIGRVLLDGGFQPQPEVQRMTQLEALARGRFIELMDGRR